MVALLFYTSSYGMIPVLSRLVKSKPVDRIVKTILYVGASSLVLIPMEQIVGSIVAVVLIIVNYDLEAGFTQDPLVLAGIIFLTFFIIFIGGIFTLISMKLYPFKGEALVKSKKDIMALHAKKETDAHSNQESRSKS